VKQLRCQHTYRYQSTHGIDDALKIEARETESSENSHFSSFLSLFHYTSAVSNLLIHKESF